LRKIAALLIALSLSGAFASGALAAVFANDPTYLSVGARELGMGRAFVGLSDDTSAIFFNPAGLSRASDWQVSTMQGRYVNTFDYLQFSALYPTKQGTFGIGYGGSSISFSFPSSEVIIIGDERRIVPTGEVSGSYGNNALLMSYGQKFSWLFFRDLGLGGSLKFLSQNLSTNAVGGGSASGMELTVGSFYKFNDDWSAGASVINALPASLGGKIKWSNNTEETLPAQLKMGLTYNTLSSKTSYYKYNLNLDYDMYLTRRDQPPVGHLGLEVFLTPNFTLRAGLDQSVLANTSGGFGISTDTSYGLGLNYKGFRFDFAYHQYNNVAADTTSYFSLSYSPEKLPPPVERKYFTVTSPGNGERVYDPQINIAGRILDKSVNRIMVGTAEAELAGDSFNLFAGANLAGNIYMVEARDKTDSPLGRYRLRVVRLVSFLDVFKGYWAKTPIEELATLGIITGYPDQTFRPEHTITRAELTALLVRSQEKWPPSARAKALKFRVGAEVGVDPYQAMLEELRSVPNFPEETFTAEGQVTRAESAAMLGRFFKLPEPESQTMPYKDIDWLYWASSNVATMLNVGAFDFISGDQFSPDRPLTLGELNAMLHAIGVEGSYPKENYDPDEKISRAELAEILFTIEKKTVAAQVTAKIEAARAQEAVAAKKRLKELPKMGEATRKQRLQELVTLGVVEVAPGAGFKLDANLTRGDLAIWLAKTSGLALPRVSKDVFSDVKRGDLLAPYIKLVSDAGLMTPYPDGTFRADKPINEADTALLTAQIQSVQTPQQNEFPDVPRNHWAAEYIYKAVDQGLVTGYPNGTFQPARPISRAEGISVIARMANLSKRLVGEGPYTDIPGRYWAASEIAAAKDEGLLDYIKGDLFEPNTALQRSEVAYVLSRINSIKQVINEQL